MPKFKTYQLCLIQKLISSWLSIPSTKTKSEERESRKRRPIQREGKENQDARQEVTSEEQDVSLLRIYPTSQPNPTTQNFQDLEIFNNGDELRAKSRRRYSKMQDKKSTTRSSGRRRWWYEWEISLLKI
jgi:hypothetical protein